MYSVVNPFDYEQKYEEDGYGDELGSNARFWRVLLDEGQAYDAEMIEGWRDTLDVLLVFAGLFSAVVTTLVVQSSQALQPDYAAISVSLLAEIVSLQRALDSGTPSGSVPRSSLALDAITATALDYWCNAFWFISLALSLSAALMSVLIKQWLQAYSSNVSGTPRNQALVRQFRLVGIERWNVPLIVGLLPMLLHISLLLFFVGLSLYVFTFDTVIASIIAGLAISVYSLYFAANILPMLDPQCPYKTPVSQYGYAALQALVAAACELLRHSARRDVPNVLPSASRRTGASAHAEGSSTSRNVFSVMAGSLARCLSRILWPVSPSRSREADVVSFIQESLTVECLNWVFTTSSNPTVASITVQAVSGLSDYVPPLNNAIMLETLKHDILSCFRRASEDDSSALTLMSGQERTVERLARSLLHFVDSGDGFTMRLLTNLKPAILRSRYPAPSNIAELEGTVMALSTAISRSNEAARAMLCPYLLPVGIPKMRLALTDSLAAMKSSLPFISISPTSALRLHPVIWHRMLRYLASESYHPAKSCTLLAVFLWNSAKRAHDYAPSVFEQPSAMGASTLYTLCMVDSDYKELVIAAVHRLLCGMSCSHGDRIDSSEDLRLHMLRRALEIYASETLTSSILHIKRQVVSATGFDEVDDANVGFLARYLDEVPREHAWELLETVTKIIAWPGLSLQTLHLFFYVYYLQGGQSTADIPLSSVGPLLRFLAKMLSARPIVKRTEKTHVTVSKIVELMSRAIELHFIEALDAIRDDDIMSALRPLALACMDNPRAARLTAALEGLLAAYLQHLVHKTSFDPSSPEAAAAR
ncbi:hypothetical protein K525DRAFT_250859 [Schizophyllum commune Loenen D]|nr:hypothetical protein K525DRAFT_250859 [Schizophyllum commune Loenen D]